MRYYVILDIMLYVVVLRLGLIVAVVLRKRDQLRLLCAVCAQ